MTAPLVLLSIGMLALLLALHPFVTYPLSLRAWRRWRGRADEPPACARPAGSAALRGLHLRLQRGSL